MLPVVAKANNVPIFPDELVKPPRDSRFKLAASMEPESFEPIARDTYPTEHQKHWTIDPEFDFVRELGASYSHYYVKNIPGAKWIQVHNMPPDVQNTIVKLKANAWANPSKSPAMHPSLCCAIVNGLPYVLANPHYNALKSLREEFEKKKQEGTPREEFLFQFFSASLQSPFAGKRYNISVTDELKAKVSHISVSCGMFEADVTIVAVIETLLRCDIPENYRDRWVKIRDNTYKLLEMKSIMGARGVEVLHA
jgi:hypothetical protein